tara:strand:- start:1250 stop:1486 length:237 start_codon:yes stop_codon:yes gene_type:complete
LLENNTNKLQLHPKQIAATVASAENTLLVGAPTDLSSNSSLHVNSDLEDSIMSSIATTAAPGQADPAIETSLGTYYSI